MIISCLGDALGLGCRFFWFQINTIFIAPQVQICSSPEYELSKVSPLLGYGSLDKHITAMGYVGDSLDNLHMDVSSHGFISPSINLSLIRIVRLELRAAGL